MSVWENWMADIEREILRQREAKGRYEGRTQGRKEGRTQGRKEGRTQGRKEGRTELALTVARSKFGVVPKSLGKLLQAASDKELDLLIERLVQASSIEEVTGRRSLRKPK